MISVIFLIPIFVISKEHDKYRITEKSFKYLVYLQNVLKDIATINFLILGSEKELSRDLALKYFSKDEYMEYDQGGIDYLNRVSYETLNTIVGSKIMNGYNKCKEFDPDLIIFMKNNHFISQEWLEEIINDYKINPLSNNYYGMNGDNIFFLTHLDDNSKLWTSETWDYFIVMDGRGIQKESKFDACLLGIPRCLYLKHVINPENCTEISISKELLSSGGIQYYNSPTHIFNIKAEDDRFNVTHMSYLVPVLKVKNSRELNVYTIPDNTLLLRDIDIINNL